MSQAVHSEKIDHAVSRLTDAGLADSASSSTTDSRSSDLSKGAIICLSVGGAALLLGLLLISFAYLRRRRKARAYNMVHRGVDMPQAPGGPGMTGGLMPLWMSNNHPSISHTPPTAHPDNASDIEKLRRYSSSGLSAGRESFASARSDATIAPPSAAHGDRSRSRSRSPAGSRGRTTDIETTSRSRSVSRDMFDADREPAENESMIVRNKFRESEFGNEYEDVNTGYGGDKRSAL